MDLTRPRKVGADRLPWCRHTCPPSITGRGKGTETCEVDSVFPPDDLWLGADTSMNCVILYNLCLDVYMMGYVVSI